MSTRKTVAAANTDAITIPRSVLKQFITLAEDLEKADGAYKPCQASIFRMYAQGLYKAPNMRTAVAQAREALENG